MDPLPLSQWAGDHRPLLIAGPCSAETEEQVFAVATSLKALGIPWFRAGVWKPRTRPNAFEGVGPGALPWLIRVQQELGLRVITEVATAAHVEHALRAGVDAMWIGARTTVNPFSVQEIADALQGQDVPVLVKNPVNPDGSLWIGALERVHRAGIRKLAAVHRGFSVAQPGRFRNPPMWEIVIELRRQLPTLPIISDPSHVAGKRDLVPEVAQTALDIGLDGLMIETHTTPDAAWSDAAQQLAPADLRTLLDRLFVRHAQSSDTAFVRSLEDLREEIDRVDRELLDVLAHRMRVVDRIGAFKRDQGVTTLQLQRWEDILRDRMSRGDSLGLDPSYVRRIYEAVHAESVRRQSLIVNDDGGLPPTPAS